MHANKDRLYVGLYVRSGKSKMPGGEDRYHWGLLVGPKTESSTTQLRRFHAKESIIVEGDPPTALSKWKYEEDDNSTGLLLVRIVVGKVRDMQRLRTIFEKTPLRPEVAGWNCIGWLREALQLAAQDGQALGTAATDWESIRDAATRYVREKKDAHRFDGKGSYYDMTKTATFDMLEGQELIP